MEDLMIENNNKNNNNNYYINNRIQVNRMFLISILN